MKVMVTGADGVLGSNLVRVLFDRGHEVRVLQLTGTTSPTLEGLPIEQRQGNILDPSSVEACMEGMEAVIHCAASTQVFPAKNDFIRRVNVEGTNNIADACLKLKVQRLIYVGTANSFGKAPDAEELADERCDYTSHIYGLDYMDSKREAQELMLRRAAEDGLPVIVVNPTFMIGAYDSKPSSGQMITALLAGKIPGFAGGGKNYIHVRDVAVAMANALTMGRIGECYILGHENLDFRVAFERMAKVLDVQPPTRLLPDFGMVGFGWLNSLFARILGYHPAVSHELAQICCHFHYFDSSKAQRELELPQTGLEQAVKDCVTWFREHNMIP